MCNRFGGNTSLDSVAMSALLGSTEQTVYVIRQTHCLAFPMFFSVSVGLGLSGLGVEPLSTEDLP